jgi:hypothetical protein
MWSAAWIPVSLIRFGVATLFGASLPPGVLILLLINGTFVGAINGGVFAVVLAIAGRRKTFEALSLPWVAACGAVGAALFPLALRGILLATFDFRIPAAALVWDLATNAVLGAGCATLTLSIARRAPALPHDDGEARAAIEAGAA